MHKNSLQHFQSGTNAPLPMPADAHASHSAPPSFRLIAVIKLRNTNLRAAINFSSQCQSTRSNVPTFILLIKPNAVH